jgi:hypothetical protein
MAYSRRDLTIPHSLTPDEGLVFLSRADEELGMEEDHIAADEVLLAVLRNLGQDALVDKYMNMSKDFYYV